MLAILNRVDQVDSPRCKLPLPSDLLRTAKKKQSASEKRRLPDFVQSNSIRGNGELTVEFRQPFNLIAYGAKDLKQKKAAGVGSDDLFQLKYTPEDSNL